jgi:hypothetical protein
MSDLVILISDSCTLIGCLDDGFGFSISISTSNHSSHPHLNISTFSKQTNKINLNNQYSKTREPIITLKSQPSNSTKVIFILLNLEWQ